jgi:hypothetical protein
MVTFNLLSWQASALLWCSINGKMNACPLAIGVWLRESLSRVSSSKLNSGIGGSISALWSVTGVSATLRTGTAKYGDGNFPSTTSEIILSDKITKGHSGVACISTADMFSRAASESLKMSHENVG